MNQKESLTECCESRIEQPKKTSLVWVIIAQHYSLDCFLALDLQNTCNYHDSAKE